MEPSSSSPSFLELPTDLHLHLLKYLHPSDILSLRKTCRLMLSTTSERSVWVHALEQTCIRETLFLPSYDTATLTLQDLERFALGPKLWENFMIKHASTSLEGRDLLPCGRRRYVKSPRHGFKYIYLVPGGRYLVTLDWVGYLRMWDLGLAPLTTLEDLEEPLNSLWTDCESFSVHPSTNGKAIRILTRQCSPTSVHTFKIIDFDPTKAEPDFEEIASINITEPTAMEFTTVCEDKIVLVHDDTIRVWNFITDHWSCWRTRQRSYQMFIKWNVVIQVGLSEVTAWLIPPLQPNGRQRAAAGEPPLDNHEPLARLKYPDNTEFPPFFCQTICDWYTGSDQPIWFDITDGEDFRTTGTNRFHRHEVLISEGPNPEVSIVSALSYSICNEQDSPPGVANLYSPYRVSDGNIFMWWSSPNRIGCQLGAQDGQSTFVTRTAMLRDVPDHGWRQTAFCPASGRLTSISVPDRSYIAVLDFLPYDPSLELIDDFPPGHVLIMTDDEDEEGQEANEDEGEDGEDASDEDYHSAEDAGDDEEGVEEELAEPMEGEELDPVLVSAESSAPLPGPSSHQGSP